MWHDTWSYGFPSNKHWLSSISIKYSHIIFMFLHSYYPTLLSIKLIISFLAWFKRSITMGMYTELNNVILFQCSQCLAGIGCAWLEFQTLWRGTRPHNDDTFYSKQWSKCSQQTFLFFYNFGGVFPATQPTIVTPFWNNEKSYSVQIYFVRSRNIYLKTYLTV